jgi:predicted dienelactone hydrolase
MEARTLRLVRLSLSIVTALLIVGPLAAQFQPQFPDPSGSFEVGRLEIDVTDVSREETFTVDAADKRRLLVTVYYPATVAAGAEHAAYGTPELAASLPFFNEQRRAWRSPGYTDVPVADGRFPVLLFSPGLGNLTLYYSSLLFELASRGYVVAALWHPYSTQVVAFPDGTVLRSNAAGAMTGVPPDQQDARLAQLGGVWAADQRFVLDRLAAWNEQHDRLRGHLDLERVGAFGHSLGGAASAQAAQDDDRIDAAINMDGSMFGTVTTDGSRAPFLLIRAELPIVSDAELQQLGMTRPQVEARIGEIVSAYETIIARSKDARSQKLEGAKHNTFMTDVMFSDLPAAQRVALVGDVDPAAAFRQISTWIGDFMATHVQRRKPE